MFDVCPKRDNKICAFCTIENNAIFCGMATNPNQLSQMTACPLDSKKKRVTTLTNWKIL